MKDKIIAIISIFIIIGFGAIIIFADKTKYEEITETNKFYVSETRDILDGEVHYILRNEKIAAIASDPDLIVYCKEHTGEVVKIKVKYRYDKTDKEYEHLEFISIEEDEE